MITVQIWFSDNEDCLYTPYHCGALRISFRLCIDPNTLLSVWKNYPPKHHLPLSHKNLEFGGLECRGSLKGMYVL